MMCGNAAALAGRSRRAPRMVVKPAPPMAQEMAYGLAKRRITCDGNQLYDSYP